jgi:hypothetical protein
MFQLFKKVLRNLAGIDPFSQGLASGPADSPADPDDVLVGRRGNVPVYIGGHNEALARLKLRPIVTRSTRHSRPHPVEQGPRGRATDRQDFAPSPLAPMARPRSETRALPVLEGPPQRTPYSGESPSGAPEARIQADRAMGMAPYSLGPRELTG